MVAVFRVDVEVAVGVLGVDGDNPGDKYRSAFLAVVQKYLSVRSGEPLPEGILSTQRPESTYYHVKNKG